MEPRKNLFSYFVISLYLIAVLYTLVSGVAALGSGQEYPYLLQGAFLVILLFVWLALNGITGIFARLDIRKRLKDKEKILKYVEAAVVIIVLAAGTFIRMRYLQLMPMEPESDYKTYYEVADLINRGTLLKEGAGYCNYIAMFPRAYGYPYVLAILFGLFGTSVQTAQYFNVVLAMGTVYLAYRIGKTIEGSICGLAALFLTAFWPSQILYINMVASEYLFSFMFILCLFLFIKTMKEYTADTKKPVRGVLLHFAIGVLLSLTAAVCPMALILLITIVICILPQKMRLPVKLPIDQPLSLRILGKGWMRCLIIVITYFCVSKFISVGISYTIDQEIASGTSSFGYNLLVGLNEQSDGGWNKEDTDYLYDALELTGSATQAHTLCRDLALERLKNSKGMFNLFARKFQLLWSNDDYGSTWNIFFMDQQGTLTRSREEFFYGVRDINNLFYLTLAAMAGVGGFFLWKRGNGVTYPFILIFLGTAGMYLFVESQNHYHYHVLFMFALLAGYTIKEIYEMNYCKVLAGQAEKERRIREKEEDEKKMEFLLKEEEELKKRREEAMGCRFDMMDALKKGYITVSISEAYEREEEQEPEMPKENKEKEDGKKDQNS